MKDILFKTEEGSFSYRVAGICVYDGKVLLQKPLDDDGYAFPGGHVAFGETNAQTLTREFLEEIGASVEVGELKWVAEIFFWMNGKPCHQLCLYHMVDIDMATIPDGKAFASMENPNLYFYWIPLEKVKDHLVYPVKCAELLQDLNGGVHYFVDREEMV